MATLKVKWESVDSVTAKKSAVVTGESADEAEEQSDEPTLRWNDKPILVYVCDDTSTCADSEKFETIVLADEDVALGVRAFRCVKMTPSQVDSDPLLADEGKTTPRVLVIDPVKVKVKVLETDDLKASKLFKTMKSVANKFWKENLDKLVKDHKKMLTEQDQLYNADKTLAEKETRVQDDEKELKEVKDERAELAAQLKEIAQKQVDLWKLTPKNKSA